MTIKARMKKVIVCLLPLAVVFVPGCSSVPKKAVDETLLSCIDKPKDEVCQILGLKGDEYFEGEGPGEYKKELSLQKEMNWCGKKLNTFIGFNAEKDGVCSIVSAKQTASEKDLDYMKSCLKQFESQFGTPGKAIIGSSVEVYDAGKLEDYFNNLGKDGLGFRFHEGKMYAECDYSRSDSDEISIQFVVTWDPSGNA